RKEAKPLVAVDDDGAIKAGRLNWDRLNGFLEPFKRGVRPIYSFKTTDDFGRQVEELLRDWLNRNIPSLSRLPWPIDVKGSPFPGLSPFDIGYAPVFFGRSLDTERAVARFDAAAERGTPSLLVVGASGVGKSSFVRAGVVPRLTTPGVIERVD